MRIVVLFISLIAFLITLSQASSARADEAARFVVVAPKSGVDAELGASLYRVLLGTAQRARFERVETVEQAVESQADVIVLAMASRELPVIQEETLRALKSRKVVGIGIGSAILFGRIGLEINEGQCAHGAESPPSVMVTNCELLGTPRTDRQLSIFKEPTEDAPKIWDEGDVEKVFGIFLPPHDELGSAVDVVARWSSHPNYAPIVRQGNCILIGVSSPASKWSGAFTSLIGETCTALRNRELEKFSTVQRKLSKPAEYEFQLARSQSTDSAFTRDFYFKFAEPSKLRAVLEHSGSGELMLSFYGYRIKPLQSERHDAFQGERLTIEREIGPSGFTEGEDQYWVLTVANFDENASARCKLKITIDQP